jgi:hypothetical protein
VAHALDGGIGQLVEGWLVIDVPALAVAMVDK